MYLYQDEDTVYEHVLERGERRLVEVSSAGKSARTQFRLLKHYPQGSFVEAELLTGRTHQIRAHARHLGMPLAGDSKYAERASLKRWRALGLKRIFLHAHRILVPGRDGEGIDVDIPLPVELRNLLDALE